MVKLTRGSIRDVKATVPVFGFGLVALAGLVSLVQAVMFLTLVCLHRYWPSLPIVRAERLIIHYTDVGTSVIAESRHLRILNGCRGEA